MKIFFVALLVLLPFSNAAADEEIRSLPFLIGGGKQIRITYKARVSPGIQDTQPFVTAGGELDDSPTVYTLASETLSVTFVDQVLNSPAYYLWNSFLQMENIITVFNKDSNPIGGDIDLFEPGGTKIGNLPYFLPGDGQFDFPLSFIPGYQAPAFGVARVSSNQESFDGSGVKYRFDPSNSSRLEFMTGMELRNPIMGRSHVLFNTMQPSRRANQLNNEVSNWLSIANVENGGARSFQVRFFNLAGQLIRNETVNIPDMGRADLEAGHVNPGVGNLGLIEIQPNDQGAFYLASLSRYGSSAPVSSLAKLFYFATSVHSRVEGQFFQTVPITAAANSETWVAVANTSSSPIEYSVDFYNASGAMIGNQTQVIAGKAQAHFFANQFLPAGTSGSAGVTANTGTEFIAEATTYFYNPGRGETTAATSIMSTEPSGSLLYGSFNRFLNISNFVKVQNFGMTPIASTLKTIESSNVIDTFSFATPAAGLSEIGVEAVNNPPPANTFGPLQLSTGATDAAIGHVLRIQPSASSLSIIDAATIIPMQKDNGTTNR